MVGSLSCLLNSLEYGLHLLTCLYKIEHSRSDEMSFSRLHYKSTVVPILQVLYLSLLDPLFQRGQLPCYVAALWKETVLPTRYRVNKLSSRFPSITPLESSDEAATMSNSLPAILLFLMYQLVSLKYILYFLICLFICTWAFF